VRAAKRNAPPIYGGLGGTESARDVRDWDAHKTIIDGQSTRRCVIGTNDATLDGFTLRAGSATNGGGTYNSHASPTVTDCILWINTPDENAGDAPSVTYSDVQGGYPGEGNIDGDPFFVDAAGDDLHLLWNSLCIDMGTGAGAPGIDRDGVSRPQGAGVRNPQPFRKPGLGIRPGVPPINSGRRVGVR